VTLSDIQRSAISGDTELTAADIATLSVITCFPDQTVREALGQLGGRDVGRLPVVDRLDEERVVGVVRRENVVAAYARLLHEQTSVRDASQRLRLSVPGLVTVRVQIPEGAQVVGLSVQDIPTPPDSLLVTIRRGARAMIPHGATVLAPGDIVTALSSPSQADRLRSVLSETTASRTAPSEAALPEQDRRNGDAAR